MDKNVKRDRIVKEAFKFREAFMSYSFAILRDWSRAEDVVQDAYIIVMNQWDDFTEGTSLYYWVRQIVHNKSMEALRARAREVSGMDEPLLSIVADVVGKFFDEREADRQRVMRRALQQCMSRLDRRSVGLLKGFYYRSMSCESIANVQKRSVNAIRLALSRLRRQLGECIARRMPALETEE
jgi:RNA polymerase sigma-70 factor (ECF subfamily)